VLVNQDPAHRWDGLLILALMFTGTTIYQAEKRQISRWWAVLTPLAVSAVWVTQNWRELDEGGAWLTQFRPRVLITLGAVAALFAAGIALRHRRVPRAMVWLGLVSYSVYLVHQAVFETVAPHLGGRRGAPSTASLTVQAVVLVALVALVLAFSALTYRFVEDPAQRLGRRLGTWIDARYGDDRARFTRAGQVNAPAMRPDPVEGTAEPGRSRSRSARPVAGR
jgi:peptidoglycan/LPS O-acetylase OafA/YrhL